MWWCKYKCKNFTSKFSSCYWNSYFLGLRKTLVVLSLSYNPVKIKVLVCPEQFDWRSLGLVVVCLITCQENSILFVVIPAVKLKNLSNNSSLFIFSNSSLSCFPSNCSGASLKRSKATGFVIIHSQFNILLFCLDFLLPYLRQIDLTIPAILMIYYSPSCEYDAFKTVIIIEIINWFYIIRNI